MPIALRFLDLNCKYVLKTVVNFVNFYDFKVYNSEVSAGRYWAALRAESRSRAARFKKKSRMKRPFCFKGIRIPLTIDLQQTGSFAFIL